MEKKDIQIVVLINGFVHVGQIKREHDDFGNTWIVIRSAKNIRNWGTESGLGQIAINGPTPNTVLDMVGNILVPLHSVIFLIECDQSKWED